jgi:tetratricopeptide (TPR) repeat protein
LELLKSLGDFHLQAQVLGNLGTLYLEMNQLEKAADFFLRDLEVNQKLDDLLSQSQTLNNLAIVCRRQQNPGQALRCYEGSLEIKKEIGDQQGELSTLINYSYLLRDIGENKRLDDTLKYARVLALSLQDSNQLSRIEELERDLLSPQ